MLGLAGDFDPAAVLGDDAVDGGEAEAGAFALFLGGEEGVEDFGDDFGWDTGAGIGDGEADEGAGAAVGVGFEFVGGELGVGGGERDGTAVGHGVAGIDGEVDDDLFHHADVGHGGVEVGFAVEDELDIFADEAVEHFEEVIDDVVQVDGGDGEDGATAEHEELAGEGGGAAGFLGEVL